MLKTAVTSKIPLIHVTSEDQMHDQWVLECLFGEAVPSYGGIPKGKGSSQIYYALGEKLSPAQIIDAYLDADDNEYSVIIINGDCTPQMMSCGKLVPDREAISEMMSPIIVKEHTREVTDLMLGLFTKDIKRVVSLTGILKGDLSPNSLRSVRDTLFLQVTGIVPVPIETDFFYPLEKPVMKWVAENRDYMFADVDKRLSPKGVLLFGKPGTGKTEFSRFVAREWGIPLFLLDLNSMLTKWQGEAESYLNAALHKLDDESPCIVLFDEVEKLFNDHSENDTSQRLLSKILWWLQYKDSNVLVVMTCNNMKAIPPELYRAGRIGSTFEMKGIRKTGIKKFVRKLFSSFGVDLKKNSKLVGQLFNRIDLLEGTNVYVTQADLTQWVIDDLKSMKFGI